MNAEFGLRIAECDKRKIDTKLKKDQSMELGVKDEVGFFDCVFLPPAPCSLPRAIGLNRKPFQIRIQTNHE